MAHLGSNAPARKWRAGAGMGCLAGGLLTLLILTGLGIAVRRSPDRFPGLVRAWFGARSTITAAEGGGTLTLEQLKAIRGVRPTVQVTLTDDEINSYLDEHPEAVGLPRGFAAPRVHFRDGQVHMAMRTRVLLIPVRVTVSMAPRIESGELKLSVTKVDAGGVSLPGELRGIAERQASRLISERLLSAGLEPESVEVGEGTLIVAAELVPVPVPEDEVGDSEDTDG